MNASAPAQPGGQWPGVRPRDAADAARHGDPTISIPAAEELLNELLPLAVRMRLFQCFLDALASEQVARMAAMRLASENAEEMIHDLTASYNRARQARSPPNWPRSWAGPRRSK